MFRKLGCFVCSLMIAGSAFSSEAVVVRFDLTESMKKFLKANEFDVTGVNYKTNEIEALLTPTEFEMIKAQKALIKFSYPQDLSAAPDSEYKNPDEIEDFIMAIHAKYPAITEVKSIGKSVEGRDIWAIKISDNAKLNEREPAILVNGMHHAREVMSPEVTTDMVEYLVTYYGVNAEVTGWVNNSQIWIIPMLNVDGNNKMWDGNAMWRKNTRDGHGVDINRNYPTGWNTCNGSSSNVYADNYRGTAPASEPETQAMMNLVAEIKPVFNISYHSFSEIVIYPFGCKPLRTPAEEAVEAIGVELGKLLDYKPGTAWELLYNADGGDIDWMYKEHHVIPYVIEVNSTFQGFQPGYGKWRNKTVLRNRPAWMHLLRKLQGPSLQGIVRKNEYKTIKISKAGTTKISQVYKINPNGSYYVILKPGKYDVIFEGSKVKRFSNLEINSKVKLNL